MIVASLGYTAEVLPGTWPGAFVNQARGLGILDTCATTGNAAAPRQDIACFLYDALTAQIGYVDKDGEWHANANGKDTMIKRLGAVDYEGGDAFVVTGNESSDINLQNYLGAYITAYASKDDDTKIIAIKEVKSEFIEGKYKASTNKIGDYKAEGAVVLGSKDDKSTDTGKFVGFTNGDVDSGITDYKVPDTNLKVAVKLSGSKITKVYSVQTWDAEPSFRAAEDIKDEISEDKTIGGFEFVLDDDDNIDVNEFSLFGASAISEIKEDDIVTVYLHTKTDDKDLKGKVVKIEVSDKTINGEITKVNKDGDVYTIGGTAYDVAAAADGGKATGLEPEAKGTFYLNYAGEIFDFDEEDDTNTNYAVLLAAGSDSARYGGATPYVKLFLADGTTKEFEVKKAATQDDPEKDTALWTGAIKTTDKGILVKYTVNSKDVVTALEKAEEGKGTEFDKNGVINNTALKSGTVIFSYKTGDKDAADSYEVLEASKLYEATVDSYTQISKDGEFKAVLVNGVSAGDEAWAMFVEQEGTDANGVVWTALYEGKVQSLTLDKDVKVSETTTSAAVFFTLTMDSDNVVTKATEASKMDPKVEPKTEVFKGLTESTAVSGNVFTATKAGEKKNYSLNADIEVYVYDASDDEWTAKTKTALAGRASAFTSITLYDMDKDGEFDIAIVVKP